jgi:hypothetical protein
VKQRRSPTLWIERKLTRVVTYGYDQRHDKPITREQIQEEINRAIELQLHCKDGTEVLTSVQGPAHNGS